LANETKASPDCANCGAAVSGSYCGACGQRVEQHLHSLWEFLAEAAEVFTHADSRLWRTLAALLLRPGYLTQQFLAGRRASYLSPFRLYLAVSILFFLVVSMTAAHTGSAAQASVSAASDLCRDSVSHVPGPDWIRAPFFGACMKSQADQGRELRELFIRNLGRAMFVFLPLLAAFMKLLYLRPARSYITHLVLLVHNHAFVFLLLSLLLATLHWIHRDAPVTVLVRGLLCYLAFYLYRSMQRVYGEGWARTLGKFSAVLLAYLTCAAATVFLTGLYSAETL
jgi:hypothetical protein